MHVSSPKFEPAVPLSCYSKVDSRKILYLALEAVGAQAETKEK